VLLYSTSRSADTNALLHAVKICSQAQDVIEEYHLFLQSGPDGRRPSLRIDFTAPRLDLVYRVNHLVRRDNYVFLALEEPYSMV
jgi:hypothetical protein